MKIKKMAVIMVAEIKLQKGIIKSTIDEVGAKMLKGSKNVFDPYTSTVYDEMMDEQIAEAANRKEAGKMAQTIIVEVIKELDI